MQAKACRDHVHRADTPVGRRPTTAGRPAIGCIGNQAGGQSGRRAIRQAGN